MSFVPNTEKRIIQLYKVCLQSRLKLFSQLLMMTFEFFTINKVANFGIEGFLWKQKKWRPVVFDLMVTGSSLMLSVLS